MYAEAFPGFDTHELRQMTLTFLQRIGFQMGDRIWIKISWDLPSALAPIWWKRFTRNGFTHLHHYVLSGHIAADGFRLWHCRAYGKDHQGVTRWQLTRKGYRDGWQFCFERSRQGATVVFYPNQPQQGIANHHVHQSRCLFYEIDDQPLSAQLETLEILTHDTQLHPAATVFTGGKSLHVYFRASSPLDPEDWMRLNRKLCILQNADPQICSLARAMRLPGMLRCKVNSLVSGGVGQAERLYRYRDGETAVVALKTVSLAQYHPTEMESALDSTGLFPYGLDDARWRHWLRLKTQAATDGTIVPYTALLEEDFLPSPSVVSTESRPGTAFSNLVNYAGGLWDKAPHPSRIAHQLEKGSIYQSPFLKQWTSGAIPLMECLTHDDRDLIQRGCAEGSRNANGYKLIRNLLGTAEFLDQQGVRYSPWNYRALFEEFCDRCTPPLDAAERDALWHSATARSATPSRTPDSILKTVSYWQAQEAKSKSRRRLRRLRNRGSKRR